MPVWKKPDYINFSKPYEKLSLDSFHTVRWPDTAYTVGRIYVCYLRRGVSKKTIGYFKLVRRELQTIRSLTPEFIRDDADCTPAEFNEMMRNWYERKRDWKKDASEVQILYLERVPDPVVEL